MNRHRAYYPRDDAPLVDGDGYFAGVNKRLDPSQLTEGYVSDAVNMRFDNGVAMPRKGIRKLPFLNPLTDDQTAREAGKIYPYGDVYGAGIYRDPDGFEWLIVASRTVDGDSVWRCRQGVAATKLNVPAGFTVDSGQVSFTQCFNVLLMHRGEDQDTLVMDDVEVGFQPVPPPDEVLGAGMTTIPNASNSVFFQNRVFVPYSRDLVWASLTLEYTHGWEALDSFRINQGSSDQLVGLYKFNDETLIAAKERSIYVVSGIRGGDNWNVGFLNTPVLDSVTTEYGCKAPKSFAQVGSDVWFLADRRGVCSISQTVQNKLHAVDVPVSRDIDPLVKNINWRYADNAVAAFWNNRYYLAVPTGDAYKVGDSVFSVVFAYGTDDGDGYGSAQPVTLTVGRWYYFQMGANDYEMVNGDETLRGRGLFQAQVAQPTFRGTPSTNATVNVSSARVGINNTVLVYDTLNKAWSGYDYGNAVDVREFIKFGYLGEVRLGIVDSSGFVSMYEDGYFDETGDPFDEYYSSSGVITRSSVPWSFTTRGYICGTTEPKEFEQINYNVSSWWPNYSVTVNVDGASESYSLKTITKDRTKYYRPFDKADYVGTNINDDFDTPHRQDYSIDTSGNMYEGQVPDQHQEVTERLKLRHSGKYATFTFAGTQGRSEVRSVSVESRPGFRRLGTQH